MIVVKKEMNAKMKELTLENNNEPSRLNIYGAAILFSFIVGFSFLGVKISMKVATPLEILTYRYNFAAIGSIFPIAMKWVKVHIKDRPLQKLMIPAGLYLGFMIFQTVGLLFASTIESGIIFAIVPILAKLIAYYYLGEKGNWKQNIFVVLSISSVITMFAFSINDFQGISVKGLILLIISSVLMALSNVFMRGVRKEFSPYAIAFAICIGGCIIFNLGTFTMGMVIGEPIDYFEPLRHWEFIISTAFLGIPSTLGSSLLMAYMLANMQAVKATIFGNLSTGISIVAGVLFLKEPLKIYHIVCALLIIIGVIGTSYYGDAKVPKGRKNETESN